MNNSKKQSPRGFFDEQEALAKLSKLQDPLEKLNKFIDFEIFRDTLNLIYEKPDRKSNAGAKPFDYVLMFKIVLLQKLYGLSDEQVEFQLNDRLSFKRFVGLEFNHRVPDYNTIWNFKQALAVNDNEKKLFNRFYEVLEANKLIVSKGKMVDASFHEVPRQRNSKEENKELKEGKVPSTWEGKKLSHKDVDARWTNKNNETFYGYKNHIKADTGSKFIDNYEVTSANVHDSNVLEKLVDEKDKGQELHGDSAYSGQDQEATIDKVKMINKIHQKGYKNRALTEEQKANNRIKSSKRARVEHIFGFMENTMKGTYIRTIGIARAKVNIGITNLVYNICRAVQLKIDMFTGDKCARSLKKA